MSSARVDPTISGTVRPMNCSGVQPRARRAPPVAAHITSSGSKARRIRSGRWSARSWKPASPAAALLEASAVTVGLPAPIKDDKKPQPRSVRECVETLGGGTCIERHNRVISMTRSPSANREGRSGACITPYPPKPAHAGTPGTRRWGR
jgi:hypothetical protein